MPTFFTLPRELREPIYRHVFASEPVKFGCKAGDLPASFNGLLTCSKRVNAEATPILCESARLDISAALAFRGDHLKIPLPLELLQHVKLNRYKVNSIRGIRQLIMNLASLRSLTYTAPFSWTEVIDQQTGTLLPGRFDGFIRRRFANKEEIFGRCCATIDVSHGLCTCSIHQLVTGWNWLGRPFKLIAEIDIFELGKRDALGHENNLVAVAQVDLNTGVFDFWSRGKFPDCLLHRGYVGDWLQKSLEMHA